MKRAIIVFSLFAIFSGLFAVENLFSFSIGPQSGLVFYGDEDIKEDVTNLYDSLINNLDDILKELSELRKAENERKIKEYEAKYNFNYNENAQDKEIIDKLLSGDVDMELMEKLAERRIKIEASNDGSTPGGRNPQNSGDVIETGSTGSTGDEDKPSFTTREEYNKILKDMGFNRARI